jgi:hypothetical protein
MGTRFMINICYLYCITNSINNKKYIGITSNPKAREYQHFNSGKSNLLSKAVEKYGKSNFIFEVICIGDRDYISNLEMLAINYYNTISPNGYNLKFGGENATKNYTIDKRSDDLPVCVTGFWFPNRRTALKYTTLNEKTFHKWSLKGTLDQVQHLSKDSMTDLPQYVSGFWFDTLYRASDKLVVKLFTLKKRIKEGFIEEKSIKPSSKKAEKNPMFGRTGIDHPRARAIKIFDTIYDSITDAVKNTDFTKSMIEKRLKNKIEGFEYVNPS